MVFSCRFQKHRAHRDDIDIRNREEIPLPSRRDPMGFPIAEEPETDLTKRRTFIKRPGQPACEDTAETRSGALTLGGGAS